MTNYIQDGKSLLWTNSTGADVSSGDMVLVGDKVGVASVDIADTETGTVRMDGVLNVTKLAGQAFAQGKKLYWDDTAKKLTTTVGSNKYAGYAHAAAASAAVLGDININR